MRRRSLGAPLAALLALVVAGPAMGTDVHVTLSVRRGQLSLARAALVGTKLQVTVVDARGTGTGWTLSAGARGAVTVTRKDATCGSHSTCTLPRTGLRYPLRLGPSGRTALLAAEKGTGMGTIRLVFDLAGWSGHVAALSLQLQAA